MCTRFPEAVPLTNIDTCTVAEELLEIVSRMGIPNRVHSDRGSQFTSEMMKEVYRLLSIRQSTTSPYHAMGNGIVENFNKTIKNLLKKIVAEKPRDWHRYLGPLMFAVRDTPQDSTGFTPFELVYGHQVRTPMNTVMYAIWHIRPHSLLAGPSLSLSLRSPNLSLDCPDLLTCRALAELYLCDLFDFGRGSRALFELTSDQSFTY